MQLQTQITWLFILAIPIACIAWTVTHEEVFSEIRNYCVKQSENCKSLTARKFFYLFTCEYCFSHYVTIFILVLTDYKLLLDDWRGYVLSGFSLVWIANIYMSLFGLLKVDIKLQRTETEEMELEIKAKK